MLVNNTGVGMVGPLEGVSMDNIRELLETNTLGVIAMTQAVLPQFRARGSGVIVNVTSGVTFQPLPLMSIHTASKATVNAFTESVALELEPLGPGSSKAGGRVAIESYIVSCIYPPDVASLFLVG